MSLSQFHLAIPVYDLPAARDFYGRVSGWQKDARARSGSTSTSTGTSS